MENKKDEGLFLKWFKMALLVSKKYKPDRLQWSQLDYIFIYFWCLFQCSFFSIPSGFFHQQIWGGKLMMDLIWMNLGHPVTWPIPTSLDPLAIVGFDVVRHFVEALWGLCSSSGLSENRGSYPSLWQFVWKLWSTVRFCSPSLSENPISDPISPCPGRISRGTGAGGAIK